MPQGTSQPIADALLLKLWATRSQVTGLGHRNLHQLRHSAATIMLAQGVPLHEVSEVLVCNLLFKNPGW